MLGGLGMPELVVIFFIILLLFGAGKIPKIASDIGGGIRQFKKAISGETDVKNNAHASNESFNKID